MSIADQQHNGKAKRQHEDDPLHRMASILNQISELHDEVPNPPHVERQQVPEQIRKHMPHVEHLSLEEFKSLGDRHSKHDFGAEEFALAKLYVKAANRKN